MNDQVRERLLRYNQAVPRYTSYPTAPHFKAVEGDATHREWLGALPAGDAVSLYFHIPFCPQLCWFCGCHTKVTRRYAPVLDYIGQLRREIDMVSATMRNTPPVTHIHFGGGSPSIMAHDDFMDFIALLRDRFNILPGAEIAMEIDPRHASEVKIAAYAKSGVTRMSFGVQDFDEKVLTAVNRAQPFSCTYDAVRLCREYGLNGINMDFMYGLPFQTMNTMRRTMDIALALAPDRISLFGYAHVPWMKKHMRLIPERALPDPELRYELFEESARILTGDGYRQIGIDHFAHAGDSLTLARNSGRLRRNFQGYTADDAPSLIGMGISAISRMPQGYAQNSAHSPHYGEALDAGRIPVAKSYLLSTEDRLRAAVIESCMCYLQFDVRDLCREHGFEAGFLDDGIEKLLPYVDDGFIRIDGDSQVFILNPHAARLACAAFDGYLSPAATGPRHAQAI